ncbi:MAG: helix-turn-helix domain-containing protein [Lentisphaeria bacterium]|nr:helix-turn-helix domain-containing protein [Lentisphaeria bacterium]
MEASYKKLWKLLIDRDMSKIDLRLKAGISTMALAKLGKNDLLHQDKNRLKT